MIRQNRKTGPYTQIKRRLANTVPEIKKSLFQAEQLLISAKAQLNDIEKLIKECERNENKR